MNNLRFGIIALLCLLLSACIGNVWTGASLVYDRHNVYVKMDDFQLGALANRVLFRDKLFKYDDCAIEVAIFHKYMLIVGRVPSNALRQEVDRRLSGLSDHKHYTNALQVMTTPEDKAYDTWITTKIRTRILADSTIDPQTFKIVTFDGVVYIMGDMLTSQATKVLNIINTTDGVVRVVKMLRYYTLTQQNF